MKQRQSISPFLSRGGHKRRREQHDLPQEHEQTTAVALGGRQTRASGALSFDKGDVRVCAELDYLVECKSTVKQSLSIKGAWLNKITTEAGPLRVPVLALRFMPMVLDRLAKAVWMKRERRVETAEADWVMIPRSHFITLLNLLGEECDGLDG